jgi:signal transduction histidine kinase/putative methionine-R-sulfoxide reductase with GAF domain
MQIKPLVVTDADALIAHSSPILPNDEQRDLLKQMFTAHRAAIAIPFVIKNEIYGGIGFYYTKERQFTQDEIDLAMTIGDQAALAIENAQAREQIEQRARVAEGMRDVFTILNSNRPFSEALEYIVKRTSELLGANSVGLYKISDDMTRVTLDAGWGMGAEATTGMTIPFNAGVMDEKYSREPLVLPDVGVMLHTLKAASPTMVTNEADALKNVKSMIATPVTIKDKLYGSLHLYYAEQRAFSEEDVELAKTLGDQAALAIENAQSREQADRRAKVAESLRDIMEVLNSDMPINKILDRIVNQACNLLGSAAVAVYKLFPEEDLLRIQAAKGLSAEYALNMEMPVGEAAVGRAVQTKKPVQVFDIAAAFPEAKKISANPLSRKLIEHMLETYRSVLAVPLIIKDEVYGGITLYYPEPREFSAEEIDLASMFANHVALAIEHDRLDTHSQEAAVSSERNRLARELHDAVTQTLFSASLIAEVLPRIWDKDEEAGRERLDELRGLTRGALAEMRTLLLELRPTALLDSDLGDLLQQLADAATTAGRVPVDVVIKGDAPVSDDVKVTFYRIAQEALNNVSKHSNATAADVTLIREHNSAKLRVLDNGRGFSKTPNKPDSLGLGIIAERAVSIGAALSIDTSLGKGTVVTVIWKNPEET